MDSMGFFTSGQPGVAQRVSFVLQILLFLSLRWNGEIRGGAPSYRAFKPVRAWVPLGKRGLAAYHWGQIQRDGRGVF